MKIELPHRFKCRPYQLPAWRAMDERKRVLCVFHRRAGKDKMFFNKLVIKAVERMANYAYYFPTATLGRRALWENVDVTNGMRVIDHIPQRLLAKKPNQTEMKIQLINGSTIQILGTDNLDVVGGNFYGTAWSEYSLQNPMAWELTRPILAENGGFAWFNGTPRGENHMYDMMVTNRDNPDWFVQTLSVEDTNAIPMSAIQDEKRQGMSDALARQEFWCDFNAANENAIFGRMIGEALAQGRIASFPIDGRVPVNTSWDLGSPQNTVVWYWQRLPYGVTRFIDCDYGLNLNMTERVAHMKAKGYNYDKHYWPHDGEQTQRNGNTARQDAEASGLHNIMTVTRTPDVWRGINRVQELFPSFEFSLPKCELGVKGLKAYERSGTNKNGVDADRPLHTWASHVADAVRTMAEAEMSGLVGKYGIQGDRENPNRPKLRIVGGYRG